MTDLKMRWVCNENNCFNKKKRLKFDLIKPQSFPGWTDIDAYCERNRHKLFMEWKEGRQDLEYAQRKAFEALITGPLDLFIQVSGDAETMSVDGIKAFIHGQWHVWEDYDLEKLNQIILRWYLRASSKPMGIA